MIGTLIILATPAYNFSMSGKKLPAELIDLVSGGQDSTVLVAEKRWLKNTSG